MINYEFEYGRLTRKVSELETKIQDKNDSLRDAIKENVEQDKIIKNLHEVIHDFDEIDNRDCWVWKLLTAGLSIYILITTIF